MFSPRLNPNPRMTSEGPLVVIDDFLENIDQFREQLWSAGGLANAASSEENRVPDVGPRHLWRQVLEPDSFPREFREAIARAQMYDPHLEVHYSTNCLYSDMEIETSKVRASFYPHADVRPHNKGLPIVFNLWLQDGGGGTGFYTFDGNNSRSSMSPEERYFAENYFDKEEVGFDPDQKFQKYNSEYRGSGPWKMWRLAEMKKNRAFVYCGDLWHRVFIPEGEFIYPEKRYSFVAFTDQGSSRFLDFISSQL